MIQHLRLYHASIRLDRTDDASTVRILAGTYACALSRGGNPREPDTHAPFAAREAMIDCLTYVDGASYSPNDTRSRALARTLEGHADVVLRDAAREDHVVVRTIGMTDGWFAPLPDEMTLDAGSVTLVVYDEVDVELHDFFRTPARVDVRVALLGEEVATLAAAIARTAGTG